MELKKTVLISECCGYPAPFVPPSLGEEGFHFCEKCKKPCEVNSKEVVLYKKIGQGHYRPVT